MKKINYILSLTLVLVLFSCESDHMETETQQSPSINWNTSSTKITVSHFQERTIDSNLIETSVEYLIKVLPTFK